MSDDAELVTLPISTYGDGRKDLITESGTIVPMQFVLELSQEMYDVEYLLHSHRISRPMYEKVSKDKQFINALEECRDLWSSSMSTQDRIRLKGAVMTEDLLPLLAGMASDDEAPQSSRISAIQLAAKLGGAFDKEESNDARKITISIQM